VDKRKAMWALAFLLPALLAGEYLSGFLTLLLLKLDTSLLQWNTYLRYLQAIELPQVARYGARIKLGGFVGFGLPIAAWLALLVIMLRPNQPSLHGEARFATGADLAKQGMFKRASDGIVVGRHGRRLLRLRGQQFVILAAPTRSGKGVGVVIPNLLDYQESVVVLDIKQENFALTSGWRKSQGHEIYLFNPFAEDRRTHRWNPMSYVSRDPAFRISDLQSIAAMLYPDGSGDQKFWISQARNAFAAFALYLFENFDEQRRQQYPVENLVFPTLGGLYRLSSGNGSDLKAFLGNLSQRAFLSSHARTAFANLLSQADETFASILGTFKEPLNAFINPVLDAATSDNDFLLTDVRRKKMTIYIGVQPNKLAESRVIVNLFFSQLINANTKTLPQDDPTLKHQCLLLMDEFTAIGKIDILATSVAYMAGYNLRLLPIIQSMAQLDAVYGKDVSRTLITNHALQILYAPREQQDANDYSDMLGYTTIRKQNVTRGRDVSRSESEERRALMLPQELKAMGGDKEVFLYEGLPHPVMCSKIKYYEDRYFTRRLLPKVEVPQLTIGDRDMRNKTVQAVSAAASLALAACASQPKVAESRISVNSAMQSVTNSAPASAPVAQTPDSVAKVEKISERLLTLIDGLRTIDDLTLDRVEKVMGVKMKESEARGMYDFQGDFIEDWYYYISYVSSEAVWGQPWFDLVLSPYDKSDPMTEMAACLDFKRFSGQLAARGFEQEPNYDQLHGSGLMSWLFVRTVDVVDEDDIGPLYERTGKRAVGISIDLPRYEFVDALGNGSGRLCINSIQIQHLGD